MDYYVSGVAAGDWIVKVDGKSYGVYTATEEGGMLAFEVGINEAHKVKEILEINGFSNIAFKKDIAGIERVVFGTVSNIQ